MISTKKLQKGKWSIIIEAVRTTVAGGAGQINLIGCRGGFPYLTSQKVHDRDDGGNLGSIKPEIVSRS